MDTITKNPSITGALREESDEVNPSAIEVGCCLSELSYLSVGGGGVSMDALREYILLLS
jgi:hypothetical protein